MTDSWTGWTAQDRADVINNAVNDFYDNDDCGLTVEAHAACDTLRAERDEALQQRDRARRFAVAYEDRSAQLEAALWVELKRHYLHVRRGYRSECFTCEVSWPCAVSTRLYAVLSAPLGAPEQVQE